MDPQAFPKQKDQKVLAGAVKQGHLLLPRPKKRGASGHA